MNKNYFKIFYKLNKKGLILTFSFFSIFGLFFLPRMASAQIEGFSLNCGWYDLFCHALEGLLSGILKIVILIFFGIPLLISALFVGIMSLILGWIISPDFISLKFTQNPFVNIGLSITQNFANMGFIIFLVAIGLATALRIEEYKAKKTLPILIIVALLINFSPVFCGFIIDASNVVMNFFLNHVTGLLGFYNFVMGAAKALWNLLVESGFNLWANISAAMQIIIMIVFNYFAGFIFILFSALFIMRYIMLWILVILSPIAFVSYILPVTRRGRSLLSWRTWWEQLVAWSIIGIIAAFFLYLGFTMIAMINANPRQFVCLPGDQNCGPGGLGLMNNILPYLIPLVLLWIAYRETRRTSAMFAREIIEMPEKVAKGAVMAATIAATAGAGAAAGGALKALPATVGKLGKKVEEFGTKHRVLGAPVRPVAKLGRWVQRGYGRRIKPAVEEKIVTPLEKRVAAPIRKFAAKHPDFTKYVKNAEEGLRERSREFLLGYRKEKGRELTPEELQDKYLKKEGRALTPSEEKSGYLEEVTEKRVRRELTPEDVEKREEKIKRMREEIKKGEVVVKGESRKLTEEEIKKREKEIERAEEEIEKGYTERVEREVKRVRELRPEEKAKKRVIENVRELTIEEITKQHVIIKKVVKPVVIKGVVKVERPGLVHTLQEGIRKAARDFIKARAAVTPLEKEREIEKIRAGIRKEEAGEELTEEELRELPKDLRDIWEEQGRKPTLEEYREALRKREKK
jgi:hypothetical protein